MLEQIEQPFVLPDAKEIPCSVEYVVRVIGGKWKMLVLRGLLFHSTLRFNQLLNVVGGISAKELTRNLRDLEQAGLVARSATAEEQHVDYALTPLGAELMPAFRALAPVGEKLRATQGC